MKIGEIGADCGFSDTSYFTKTFREIKHCTPREYRQKFAGREQSLGGTAAEPVHRLKQRYKKENRKQCSVV